MARILSIGDCNTLGVAECAQHAYPERLGELLGLEVLNCGVTMATTREGRHLWSAHRGEDLAVLTVQFGLVDSWRTIRHAPYVLYYPDNPWRKLGRKFAKKYKKFARKAGLRAWLGEDNLVPLAEYVANVEAIVADCPAIACVLIDTLPNRDLTRNAEIARYNAALDGICAKYPHCARLRLFDHFLDNLDSLYLDATHINARGHQLVADGVQQLLRERGQDGA